MNRIVVSYSFFINEHNNSGNDIYYVETTSTSTGWTYYSLYMLKEGNSYYACYIINTSADGLDFETNYKASAHQVATEGEALSEILEGGIMDHGTLSGLLDDDHPQYLLENGTRPLSGNLNLGGNKIENLGAGSSDSDAIRRDQAMLKSVYDNNDDGIIELPQLDTNISNHINDTTSNPHNVDKIQVGLGNVTDDEQLKRESGDFDTFSNKTTLVDNDILLIEDSEDSLNKKKVLISDLFADSKNNFNELDDTPTDYTGQADRIVKVKTDESGLEFADSKNNFTDLDDTPTDYNGQADRIVKVKTDESGLEFINSKNNFTDLNDTPADYTGQADRIVKVKTDESGLEFTDNVSADSVFEEVSNVIKEKDSGNYDNDFIVGSPQLDYDSDSNHVNRMFFDKDKGAFRVGSCDNNNWDNGSIGLFSFAEGYNTQASDDYSHAEGRETTANGHAAHSEGYNTQAIGDNSHAEGYYTTSNGIYGSHAEGNRTTASGQDAHAEGIQTLASGSDSHAEGRSSISSGDRSHAEGDTTTASGNSSHSEGLLTEVSGNYSHVEGYYSITSGNRSHAEGDQTTASGIASHSEGVSTEASGDYSHAEGGYTIASGYQSHAEGGGCQAIAPRSHAGGKASKAHLYGSFARGCYYFGEEGDSQYSQVVEMIETTNNSWTTMYIGGAGLMQRLYLPANRTWSFHIIISARQVGGTAGTISDSAGYEIKGLIKRTPGDYTTLIGTPIITVLAEEVSAWDVRVIANDTLEALEIQVLGETDKTIHWVAVIHLTEVG